MDIVISNLSKKFGEKKVIADFSIRIKEGSVLSIMAPSGGGKTTLLRILAGLETADKEGLENRKISMVFQEDRLCSNLSAVSNIRFVCGKKIMESKIYNELEEAGLKGNEKYPVRELSGGMRRRIAIVRALTVPCDVLKTVILVTHDKEEAEAMGGNILYLK